MKYKLYDYQEYATQWILDKEKAGLLLDMGMGKSVITLTAIDELMFDYFEVSKVLGTEKERINALYTKADICRAFSMPGIKFRINRN